MLFRGQAVEANRVRLYGKVLIVNPISFRIVTCFLLVIVISFVVYMSSVSFPRTESVSGAVVPSGGIVSVIAPVPGFVTEFDLVEGQHIVQGERLGRISTASRALDIDGTQTGAQLASISSKLSHLELRRAQMRVVDSLDLAELSSARQENEIRLTNAKLMRDFQVEILAEVRTGWDREQQLAERNLVSANELSQQNLELISNQRELARLESEVETLTLQNYSIELSRKQILSRSDLRDIEFDAEESALLLEKQAMLGRDVYEIVAPVSGTAVAILVSDENDVQAMTELFSVLPDNSTLEVELYVASRAIGFISPGQSVSLLFDAFPYQRFGSQPGTISEITGSVIMPGSNGLLIQQQEPVYRVTVALERNTVAAFGRELPIQPGMLLNANIILEERTVLDWLLEPFTSISRRTQ